MKIKLVFPKFFLSVLFLFSGLFLIISSAKASTNFLGTWDITYPYSNTYDASCQICHSDNLETLNAYGRDICLIDDDFSAKLAAVEALDSDGDGTSNLTEIMTNAQPGWTEGENSIYYSDTCADALLNISVPPTIPKPYDPEFNFFIFMPFIFNSND